MNSDDDAVWDEGQKVVVNMGATSNPFLASIQKVILGIAGAVVKSGSRYREREGGASNADEEGISSDDEMRPTKGPARDGVNPSKLRRGEGNKGRRAQGPPAGYGTHQHCGHIQKHPRTHKVLLGSTAMMAI